MDISEKLKGGVIIDVISAEQMRAAEVAGATGIMALEKVPADIRAAGGVSRMSDPKVIKEIMKAIKIPVIAKVRIGHFVEVQILESLGIDYTDEPKVLSPVDDKYHIDKSKFNTPFVRGARNLSEALRRIKEGAKMIRTKGEAETGDVVQAVTHMRQIMGEISLMKFLEKDELYGRAREMGVCFELLKYVHENGKLPVLNFFTGGVTTPADAALIRQSRAEGVFVGSGIFKSGNPEKRTKAIVKAVENYNNPDVLLEMSRDLEEAMMGINPDGIKVIMANR